MKKFQQQFRQSPLAGFRLQWGLSQQQLADHLQLSSSMIGMIENGKRQLPARALLQLAQVEIKLAASAANPATATDYTHPGTRAKYQDQCERLKAKALFCRLNAGRQRAKLKEMMALYQKNSEWLKLITLQLAEAGNSSSNLAVWKKHEIKATLTLQNCCVPLQVLLLHHITALDEEAELHQKKLQQLQQELPLLNSTQTV
jgi:transcriptional regulator with XRE-family HTH domain